MRTKTYNPDQARLLPDVAHARHGDPETSHLAAATVDVSHHKQLVLAALIPGPTTHEGLQERIRHYFPNENPSEQSIRSRCKQLENDGKVRRIPGAGKTARGRKADMWELA